MDTNQNLFTIILTCTLVCLLLFTSFFTESGLGSPTVSASSAMASSNPASMPAVSKQIVNTGFDPAVHGFRFPNYGGQYPEGNITHTELRSLFGDEIVCQRVENSKCIPTAEAQMLERLLNQDMQAGHCVGFSVLSHRLWSNQVSAGAFQSTAQSAKDIEQTIPIMKAIAQNHALQHMPEIKTAVVQKTPKEVLADLITALSSTSLGGVDVGVISRQGFGHSLLAYGVEDKGNDIFWINVYDSNHPGEALYIEVNTAANTWRYSMAAVNPQQDATAWDGDANTYSLIFIPMTAYNADRYTWPLGSSDQAGRGHVIVAMRGDASFVVDDGQGNLSGVSGSGVVNNIPGSYTMPARTPNHKNAFLAIPADALAQGFSVRVNNQTQQSKVIGELFILAPNMSTAIEDLTLLNNQTEEVQFNHTQQRLTYNSRSGQAPTIKVALTDGNGTDNDSHLIILDDMTMTPNSSVTLDNNVDLLDPNATDTVNNGLSIESTGLVNELATLVVAQLDVYGEHIFANDKLLLQPSASTVLDIDDWNGIDPIDIAVDTDGDGVLNDTPQLDNEFPAALLTGVEDGDDLVELAALASYMDSGEAAVFLEQLSTVPIDGDDLGRTLYAFDDLDLTLQQFSGFANTLGLSTYDLTGLINELRLGTVDQSTLLAGLGLDPAAQAALELSLVDYEYARTLHPDIDLLALQAGTAANALAQYLALNGRNLSPITIAALFEQYIAEEEPDEDELARVIRDSGLSGEALQFVINNILSQTSLDNTGGNANNIGGNVDDTASSVADSTSNSNTGNTNNRDDNNNDDNNNDDNNNDDPVGTQGLRINALETSAVSDPQIHNILGRMNTEVLAVYNDIIERIESSQPDAEVIASMNNTIQQMNELIAQASDRLDTTESDTDPLLDLWDAAWDVEGSSWSLLDLLINVDDSILNELDGVTLYNEQDEFTEEALTALAASGSDDSWNSFWTADDVLYALIDEVFALGDFEEPASTSKPTSSQTTYRPFDNVIIWSGSMSVDATTQQEIIELFHKNLANYSVIFSWIGETADSQVVANDITSRIETLREALRGEGGELSAEQINEIVVLSSYIQDEMQSLYNNQVDSLRQNATNAIDGYLNLSNSFHENLSSLGNTVQPTDTPTPTPTPTHSQRRDPTPTPTSIQRAAPVAPAAAAPKVVPTAIPMSTRPVLPTAVPQVTRPAAPLGPSQLNPPDSADM